MREQLEKGRVEPARRLQHRLLRRQDPSERALQMRDCKLRLQRQVLLQETVAAKWCASELQMHAKVP